MIVRRPVVAEHERSAEVTAVPDSDVGAAERAEVVRRMEVVERGSGGRHS
jgi:hypothetical protein